MFGVTVQKIDFSPCGNDGSFLQTPFWGLFKSRHGWNLIRARASFAEGALSQKQFDFSILVRSFAKGFFSLAYVPMFPSAEVLQAAGVGANGGANDSASAKEDDANDSASANEGGSSNDSPSANGGANDSPSVNDSASENDSASANEGGQNFCALLDEVAAALKPFLPQNTICVRFDPELGFDSPAARDAFVKEASRVKKAAAKKNSVDIQPPDTTQVDLTKSEEEVLAAMKNKWRYNIKLAQKKGVVVQKAARDSASLRAALDIFYDLYKVTSERDGIAMHAKAYYQDLLELSAERERSGEDVPQVNLYIAKHEDDNLGAIMTLFSKTEAVYLYGCSSNVKRNLMPNFLLQWTAMQDAKAYGSRYYDMYGMPPTDDPNHPMHGLYLFKTGFGGRNVHRVGSWDVPLKGIYKLCVLAENMRAFWHKKVLKKIRGR